MSIVQFQLPSNQAATMVQSVIQPNHQSVIQPTNPISAIQVKFEIYFKVFFLISFYRFFLVVTEKCDFGEQNSTRFGNTKYGIRIQHDG